MKKSGIENTQDSLQSDREKLRNAYEEVSVDSVSGYSVGFNAVHDTPKAGVILTIRDGAFQAWQPN